MDMAATNSRSGPATTDTDAPSGTSPGRQRWPLWGAAAGVLGAVGHLVAAAPAAVFEAQSGGEGVGIIDLLDRGIFHLGAVAGYGAVLCLLVFAAAWRRWIGQVGIASTAARALPLALAASAAAMILGYGMMGALSVYLPGGINAGEIPNEGLYVLWMFLDLGPFMAWWGVVGAALLVSYISLIERRLPVWLGVVGVLAWLPPVGFLVVTGLTGFAGVVGPVWLVVTAVGLAVSRLPDAAHR
jgi:hypothetical protein